MTPHSLYFWRQEPHVKYPAPKIAQELQYGEEVTGLIDLPIKEIIDKIKLAFPACQEKAGLLLGVGSSANQPSDSSGRFEVTWAWQFVRIDCFDLPDDDRQQLIDILQTFQAPVFDQTLGLRRGTE